VAAGSVQYIVECAVRVPATAVSLAPCTSVTGVGYAPKMVQAYVIDPASASYIDAVAAPYNYANGAALWGFAFTFVLTLYLVAHSAGLIMGFVRRG